MDLHTSLAALAAALAADAAEHARHAYAIERSSRRMDSVGSVLLASAIGIALALALAHWWSA